VFKFVIYYIIFDDKMAGIRKRLSEFWEKFNEHIQIKLTVSLILILILTLTLSYGIIQFGVFLNLTPDLLIIAAFSFIFLIMIIIPAIVFTAQSIYSVVKMKKEEWTEVEPVFDSLASIFATVQMFDWLFILFSIIIFIKFPYSTAMSAMMIVFFRMMRPSKLPKSIGHYSKRWWSNWVFFYGLLLGFVMSADTSSIAENVCIFLLFVIAILNELIKNAFIKSNFGQLWTKFFENLPKNHPPQNILLYGHQEGLFFNLKYAFIFFKRLDLVYRQKSFIVIGKPSIKAIDDWETNMTYAGPQNVENALKEISKLKDFYTADNFSTFEKIIEISKNIDSNYNADEPTANKRKHFIKNSWFSKLFHSIYNTILDKIVIIIVGIIVLIIIYFLTGRLQVNSMEQLVEHLSNLLN